MGYDACDYYSGSALATSGSTQDLIASLETRLGVPHLVLKQLTITSGSNPIKYKINDDNYWNDSIMTNGSYVMNLNKGDVLISTLYASASLNALSVIMLY
jgi:hypothetical protein